jgi:hypothetical protein
VKESVVSSLEADSCERAKRASVFGRCVGVEGAKPPQWRENIHGTVARMSREAVVMTLGGQLDRGGGGELEHMGRSKGKKRRERKTHWKYVRGHGHHGICPECSRPGYLSVVRLFDGSTTMRASHSWYFALIGRTLGRTHFVKGLKS